MNKIYTLSIENLKRFLSRGEAIFQRSQYVNSAYPVSRGQPMLFWTKSATCRQYRSVSSFVGPSTMTRHMFWVPE